MDELAGLEFVLPIFEFVHGVFVGEAMVRWRGHGALTWATTIFWFDLHLGGAPDSMLDRLVTIVFYITGGEMYAWFLPGWTTDCNDPSKTKLNPLQRVLHDKESPMKQLYRKVSQDALAVLCFPSAVVEP